MNGPVLTHDRAAVVGDVIAAVESVLGRPDSTIALHEPELTGNAWHYVKDCLDSGWVSSVGAYVDRFERDLAAFTGTAHAIATVNGTAALHVSLLLAGVEPGDEVLLPTLTFIATANAVSYAGAVPHFVESERQTLGVDAVALDEYLSHEATISDGICRNQRTGARIKALVVMHVFGHPCDLDALAEVARRWNLVLIEDAAESLGSFYKGRHTGNTGQLSALSFNGNKIMTTGGGGAILTNDPVLAKRAKHLTTTARAQHAWSFLHDEIGFNYRLPNLNAALGCAQIEDLPRFLSQKRTLAARYASAFSSLKGVRFLAEPPETRSNYWLNAIVLETEHGCRRDELLKGLNEAGYMSRPIWTLMHKLPMYRSCPQMPMPVAEGLEATVVNLPSSAKLGS